MGSRIESGGDAAWDTASDFGDALDEAGDAASAEAFDAVDDGTAFEPAGEDLPPSSVEDTFGWPENAEARGFAADVSCTAEEAGDEAVADTGTEPRRVVVGAGQGVLAALRSSGVEDADLPAAYGALVRDGQLGAADFVRGTPIVQPGRSFTLDSHALDDDAASLGRRLIGAEHRERVAADVEAIQSRTRPTQAQRDADPNWRLVNAARQREQSVAPVAPAPAPAPVARGPVSADYDDVVLAGWENFKREVREDNAALQASDDGVLGVASHIVAVPRELGFGLITSGLSLGRGIVGAAESVAAGTALEDAERTFGPALRAVATTAPTMDHVRVSVSRGDYKAMIGTDRIGVQYKEKPKVGEVPVDQVTRLTHRWGDDAWVRADTMIEKNFDVLPPIPGRGAVAGLPVQRFEVVPGLRQNPSGGGAVTPSLNLDVVLPDKWKITLELRKSGG